MLKAATTRVLHTTPRITKLKKIDGLNWLLSMYLGSQGQYDLGIQVSHKFCELALDYFVFSNMKL